MLVHLKNYEVVKDIKITNEGLVNFGLFVDWDPISYEETRNNEKWIQPMNEEIQSIKKNNK